MGRPAHDFIRTPKPGYYLLCTASFSLYCLCTVVHYAWRLPLDHSTKFGTRPEFTPPSLPPCPPPSNRQFTFTPPVPSTPVLPSWPKIWSAQLLDCLLLASSLKGRAGYVLRSQMTRLTWPTTICSAKASLLNSGRATGLKRKYDMRKCAMCRASIPPSKHPRKWQRYCYPCVLKNKRWKINIIHPHHRVCHCLKDSEERIGADWDGVTVLEDNNDRQAVIMPEYFATAIESRK